METPHRDEGRTSTLKDGMKWKLSYGEVPDTCASCRHSFCKEEYDEERQYFCGNGAGPRPACGSVYMKESLFARDVKGSERMRLYREAYEAWRAWKQDREVSPWGRCLLFDAKRSKDEKRKR